MCAWVLTIALTVSLWRPRRSRMRLTSSPGSTTSASRVSGSPMMEQLHCNIPTGMVIWINPSWAALREGRPSLMRVIITSQMKGFLEGAAWTAQLVDRLCFDGLPFARLALATDRMAGGGANGGEMVWMCEGPGKHHSEQPRRHKGDD